MSVLILDHDQRARERRADCLRRWGHAVQSCSVPSEFPPSAQLPPNAVLIARQELTRERGIECIDQIQRKRPDIAAILITNGWSSALAAAVSSRRSVWLRKEPMSDEELHLLVDFCSTE